MRHALETWAQYLEGLIGPDASDKVVPIRAQPLLSLPPKSPLVNGRAAPEWPGRTSGPSSR